MKNWIQSVAWGLLFGFLIALLVSAVPTFLDWQANPAGIFRSSMGTNWGVVFETVFSWLWPLFLFFAPVSIAVKAWGSSRRSKHAT